ncbi:MAG: Na-translocating system protein MpsC family protein [Thermodesulfobacteriota bacterium]
MDPRSRDALTRGIARICADLLGAEPGRVEVHGGEDLAFAVLRECLPPAEEALSARQQGRGLLREYHDACSAEVFPALAELVRETLGKELASAALEPLQGTRHKLLVLAFEAVVPPKPPSIREEEDT